MNEIQNKQCAKEGCEEDSTTTIRYPYSDELRSYCDLHIRHLMEMQVPFEGTMNPENPGENNE